MRNPNIRFSRVLEYNALCLVGYLNLMKSLCATDPHDTIRCAINFLHGSPMQQLFFNLHDATVPADPFTKAIQTMFEIW